MELTQAIYYGPHWMSTSTCLVVGPFGAGRNHSYSLQPSRGELNRFLSLFSARWGRDRPERVEDGCAEAA
jgi:hypothetical protein